MERLCVRSSTTTPRARGPRMRLRATVTPRNTVQPQLLARADPLAQLAEDGVAFRAALQPADVAQIAARTPRELGPTAGGLCSSSRSRRVSSQCPSRGRSARRAVLNAAMGGRLGLFLVVLALVAPSTSRTLPFKWWPRARATIFCPLGSGRRLQNVALGRPRPHDRPRLSVQRVACLPALSRAWACPGLMAGAQPLSPRMRVAWRRAPKAQGGAELGRIASPSGHSGGEYGLCLLPERHGRRLSM